jgi:hypothetical protein
MGNTRRFLIALCGASVFALSACEGPGPPKGSARLTLELAMSPQKSAELVTVRASSRTDGNREHQLSIRRSETCQGSTNGTGSCDDVPDLLFQIEAPGKPTPPASAFEATYKCWFGSCPSLCYVVSADGQRVTGVAPSCDGAASYVTVDCQPDGQDCEQTFSVRVLTGTSSTINAPLEISLLAIGRNGPVTADLVRTN